jgi:hypothetical protein
VSIVDQVEALIRQAGAAETELARTSAWVACKKIREHGLRVVVTAPAPEPAPPPPPAAKPPKARKAQPPYDWGPPPPKRPAAAPKWPSDDDRVYPMRMLSVHGDSQCERCCERSVIGTPIRYARGCTGWIHEACGKFSEVPA